MFYIYFPYALVLSGLMLLECYRKEHPKWWAAVVLLAPITTPYFIFKTRKIQGMILFMVFLSTFLAVIIFESLIYFNMREENKYEKLPPVTRQVMRLSETLKSTTQELDAALVTLEKLSKVESRISELQETMAFIVKLRAKVAHNKSAIERLVKFTEDHAAYFVKKDLDWVYRIQEFYTSRIVRKHYESLETYLNDFESLLEYTYINFTHITKYKDPTHLTNYDEYYLRYRRAVDAHNKFNVQRIEYQNEFLVQYPAIKPYLPGKRQTETFLFWGE